jgi:hypothetical protein
VGDGWSGISLHGRLLEIGVQVDVSHKPAKAGVDVILIPFKGLQLNFDRLIQSLCSKIKQIWIMKQDKSDMALHP